MSFSIWENMDNYWNIEKDSQPIGQPMGQPPVGQTGQQAWPIIVTQCHLGPKSEGLKCPYCSQNIQTVIETQTSNKAGWMATLLCLLG